MKKLLCNYILPPILWGIIHLWCKTLRIKNLNPEMDREIKEKPGGAIYTFWHSHLFYLFYHYRFLNKFTLMISPSQDGELLAALVKLYGYPVVRASSYKNTIPGTRELAHLLKKDAKVIIIADGSRGPRHRAQVGSVQLARMTGVPVYTLSYDAHPKHELNSWDRFILPLPFSKVTLNFGAPITVAPKADKDIIRQKQEELTDALNQITRACERP
ncbi:MAG: DUF374 domain-containing protein [Nitrospina sp.]|nr:lysophospholipid acyltransferase family protein [Nitrospinota bacterium]TDJ50935.1 MAG: DUF374 domain-containing protein [Nitrospina sp.]